MRIFHPFSYTVCFADTDSGGVVYYARYLEIAERARAAMLQEVGLSNKLLQQQGFIFAVRECHVQYHFPARLDDVLMLQTRLISLQGARLFLEQQVRRQDEALVSLSLTLACLNTSGKPVRIPASIVAALCGV